MENGPIWWPLLLQLILIFLNAIFACAEIAVVTMNDARLAILAEQGDRRAVRLARLTNQPARFLATIQVAITLSGFFGSAFAADNFAELLSDAISAAGSAIPKATLDTIAVVLITLLLSYFTLVLGELVPKRIAMKNSEKLALGMSALISFISTAFSPIVGLLTVSTNGVLRLLGIDPADEGDTVTEEQIRMMVDVGSEKGTIDPTEKALIKNVFEFDDLTAGEIATHRREVSLLWTDETPADWERTIHESRHTMFPVCGETTDNVVGVLNAKDFFSLTDRSHDSVMGIIKPAYFVPESVKADVLFRNMKRTRSRFAVVLDEYGGMLGVVTINDLLEQLVGEFDDGDDPQPSVPDFVRIDSGTWRISGGASLEDVQENLGVELPCDEYETLGGLIFGQMGAIPADGSSFEVDACALHIRVLDVREHRVETAIVCVPPEPAPAEES